MLRMIIVAILLALPAPASLASDTVPLDADRKREAAAALDHRIACAAFYRLTYDLLTGARATEDARRMAADYDAAGRNLLVQANTLADAIGESADLIHVKFKTAVIALRERVEGSSVVYNDLARRLNPACERLIAR